MYDVKLVALTPNMLDNFFYVDKIITETVVVAKTHTEKPGLVFLLLFLIECAVFLFFIVKKITIHFDLANYVCVTIFGYVCEKIRDLILCIMYFSHLGFGSSSCNLL
jgi:hypothetical protein